MFQALHGGALHSGVPCSAPFTVGREVVPQGLEQEEIPEQNTLVKINAVVYRYCIRMCVRVCVCVHICVRVSAQACAVCRTGTVG